MTGALMVSIRLTTVGQPGGKVSPEILDGLRGSQGSAGGGPVAISQANADESAAKRPKGGGSGALQLGIGLIGQLDDAAIGNERRQHAHGIGAWTEAE